MTLPTLSTSALETNIIPIYRSTPIFAMSENLYNTGDGTYCNILADLNRDILVKSLRCVPGQGSDIIEKVNSAYESLASMWLSMSHDHICRYTAINFTKGSIPTIEVTFYKEGNILSFNKRNPNADKLQQVRDVAAGLTYLHRKNIAHGNICPTNILMQNNGRVCISDACHNILIRRLIDGASSIPSSYAYKAPEELLETTGVSAKADVYSWACVVFQVFSGQRPYGDQHYGSGILNIISRGHGALPQPPQISKHLWKILQKCWELKPEDRPTMNEVELELHELSIIRKLHKAASLQGSQAATVLCAA